MKFSTLFLIVLILIFTTACAHKQTFKDLSAWSEEKDKSIQLSVRALKIKGPKVDVTVGIKNDYPFTVVIPANSLRFVKSGDQGVGDRNPHWVLKSGDMEIIRLKLKLADKEEGPSTLKLDYLYEGEETIANGIKTNSNTQGSATVIGGRGLAFGSSDRKTTSTSEVYKEKSAIEGRKLPPVVLEIPE